MGTMIYRNVHGVTVFHVETEDDAVSPELTTNAKTMLDLNQIRQSLEQKLARRVARAEKIDERLRQPGDEDWQEQAMQREDDEVLESLGSQAVREIGQIRQALGRLDKGTYGVCAHCGKQIALERLELLPYAINCVQCV